jgi:hypothetical protein
LRLYYLERLRPKQEAAARVFGAVMHLALAEYFRRERDPLATFREEWPACQNFQLRYSQRESWHKLNQIGEALLQKFLAEEAHKFEQVFAVEAKFHIGASNLAAPLVGTLDLVAQLEGKRTLVEFKTGVNDWGEYDVLLSDQLTAYRLAEPEVEQTAICVLVKRVCPRSFGISPSARLNSRLNTSKSSRYSRSRSPSASFTSESGSGAGSASPCQFARGTKRKSEKHW